MQPWQIKALKLEVSGLDALNGYLSEHALYFLVAIIGLLVVLLGWVLSGGLLRKLLNGRPMPDVQPTIVIQLPGTPPPPAEPPFDPFPPLREPPDYYEHDDDYPLE